MKIWYSNLWDTKRKLVRQEVADSARIMIGRARRNQIVLNSKDIDAEHAILLRRSGGFELVVTGTNGLRVGKEKYQPGSKILLKTHAEITVGPYSITLDLPKPHEVSEAEKRYEYDVMMTDWVANVHQSVLGVLPEVIKSKEGKNLESNEIKEVEDYIESVLDSRGFFTRDNTTLINHVSGHAVRSRLLSDLVSEANLQNESSLVSTHRWTKMSTQLPDKERQMASTVQYSLNQLKVSELETLGSQLKRIDRYFWDLWKQKIRESEEIKRYYCKQFFKKEVKDLMFGLGPLEDLLRLPTVSEIMVVDHSQIYIEKDGTIENSGRRFISDADTERIIKRIVQGFDSQGIDRTINNTTPLVDARLPDGSRVNAIISPLAVSGPCLTIRKFPQKQLLLNDLVEFGTISTSVAHFMNACVLGKSNILVAGGTGTGKTTFLNCLGDLIPDKQRIVTVEDTAELRFRTGKHVVRLETKEKNMSNKGEYTIRDLVKNALRMRPDRIIVGECRGAEALDMLQAMNTGHDGCLTTIHANSARDVILRLEVLVQMGMDGDLPIESIHRQVASAIDLIVQLNRVKDDRPEEQRSKGGTRRVVTQISEVVGIDPSTKRVRLKDLFVWSDSNFGELVPTGRLPTFIDRLIKRGFISLDQFYL